MVRDAAHREAEKKIEAARRSGAKEFDLNVLSRPDSEKLTELLHPFEPLLNLQPLPRKKLLRLRHMAGTVPDQQISTALNEMHIFVALITPLFDASRYIPDVEVPIAKRRNKKGEVLIAPVVVSDPGGRNCDWLLSLERLPHKQKSWADIRKECRASEGEYDEAIQPLRDGIWKLVERVRSRPNGVGVRIA